jgi:hypothetical protein
MNNFDVAVLVVTATVAGIGWTAAADDTKEDVVKKELEN